MAQQLQEFTIRMMQGVVHAHQSRTDHDAHCCALADSYLNRLNMEAKPSSIPQQAAPQISRPRRDLRPLTPPMAQYIRSLRRKVSIELLSPRHRELVTQVVNGDEILFSDAKGLIEALKSLADSTIDARYVEPSYIPEEGPYQVDDETFYLVVTAKETGRRYAKKFNPDTRKFFYVGQAPFRILTEDRRMNAMQAKVFGDLFSVCCNCGKRLTKRISIDHGYGPVCAEHNGWPY